MRALVALHPNAHTTRVGGPGLAANFDGGTAGDRYQVVLHVNADDAAGTQTESPASSGSPAALDGVIEVDHGALYVSTETSRRLACDASVVKMRHDADGAVLDRGPQNPHHSAIHPPRPRRARHQLPLSRLHLSPVRRPPCGPLGRRGRHEARQPRAPVPAHHRAIHEGGFGVIRGLDGALSFLRPDGAPLQAAPAAPTGLPLGLFASTAAPGKLPTWDGTRFDLPWAIDVLYRGAVVEMNPDRKKEEEGGGSCGNRSVVSKELVGALPV